MFKLFEFVNRKTWGAAPPRFEGTPLPERVEHLVLIEAGIPSCCGVQECSGIIRRMQKFYMNLGMMDIPYNFIVSKDYFMFEIRGWKWTVPTPDTNPEWKDNAIVIAQVGDYDKGSMESNMMMSSALTFRDYYAAKTHLLAKECEPHILVPNWNTIEDLDEVLVSDL